MIGLVQHKALCYALMGAVFLVAICCTFKIPQTFFADEDVQAVDLLAATCVFLKMYICKRKQ